MKKRTAKKILKQYGKAAYQERIQYANSFLDENMSAIKRISYKHMLKRCTMIAVILILMFALLVVTASAFGIHLFNFSFFEKTDYTQIISNTDARENSMVEFYSPSYIPEGYFIVMDESFTEIEKKLIYENKEKELLHIEQNLAEGFALNINSEDCEIKTKTLENIEITVYNYTNYSVFVFQYNNTFIKITSVLPEQEIDKIVTSLSPLD